MSDSSSFDPRWSGVSAYAIPLIWDTAPSSPVRVVGPFVPDKDEVLDLQEVERLLSDALERVRKAIRKEESRNQSSSG